MMGPNSPLYTQPYFRRAELRFECTGCAGCCRGEPNSHVFLESGEAEAVRGFLGLTRAWFRRRYLRRTEEGEEVLASGPVPGHCVFLEPGGRCRVYPVRPLQCRAYPFWPELVMTGKAWVREARRCEGIGRGEAVPRERIERWLAVQAPSTKDEGTR